MNRLTLGVIMICLILVGIILVNSNVNAQLSPVVRGNTVHTFWGTETCPNEWKILQRGHASIQFKNSNYFGDTLCVDNGLTAITSRSSNILANESVPRVEGQAIYWTANNTKAAPGPPIILPNGSCQAGCPNGSTQDYYVLYHDSMPCVVCARQWILE